ncbi:hypothetical protein hamaS1_13800 [Moorella sp. Hama-1]|nr:ATP-binding protein [Moorella sp. Hama-1]BCV21311.1 hypothetical protein hamaS1_13800 [Moorella sp. Hama-1]
MRTENQAGFRVIPEAGFLLNRRFLNRCADIHNLFLPLPDCIAKFYRGAAKRQFHRKIELMRGLQFLQAVVIVDEAHLLDREMLEEVRFQLNFQMDSQSPMALILVGQLWD